MIDAWADGMHEAYDGGWTTHSNAVVTRVAEHLVAEPGEMLILEREATAPGSWEGDDNEVLFGVHNDTESNLARFAPGDELPLHSHTRPMERWQTNEDVLPSWATDWSKTYILHAFGSRFSGSAITGFTEITPRYVLDRQSNFARAVYPVARIMYERGLITFNNL